jgi:hypothetical protein
MKSWDAPKSQDMIAKMCNLIRKGDLTDESLISLEICLKQLEEHLLELETKSVENVESVETQFESVEDPTLPMAIEFEYLPKLKKFI